MLDGLWCCKKDADDPEVASTRKQLLQARSRPLIGQADALPRRIQHCREGGQHHPVSFAHLHPAAASIAPYCRLLCSSGCSPFKWPLRPLCLVFDDPTTRHKLGYSWIQAESRYASALLLQSLLNR